MHNAPNRHVPAAFSTLAVAHAEEAFIRQLRTGDCSALRRMVTKCTDECLRDRFFGYVADPTRQLAAQVQAATREGRALGAFVDDAMVGLATALPDPAGATWELSVLVRDDWQGHGLGTRLVCWLVTDAHRAGATPAAVFEALNWRARRLARGVAQALGPTAIRVEVC